MRRNIPIHAATLLGILLAVAIALTLPSCTTPATHASGSPSWTIAITCVVLIAIAFAWALTPRQHLAPLRLRIAAAISGTTIHTFQGRNHHGQWIKGHILTTTDGLKAMKAPFRPNALVYSDTALTEP